MELGLLSISRLYMFFRVTHQLDNGSVTQLFNEPSIAYSWKITGKGSVIRLRNISD